MEILYCEACGHRITEADLRAGVVRQENNVYCPKCVAAGLAPKAQPPATAEMPAPVRETARILPVAAKSDRRPSRVNLVPVRRDTAPAEPVQALLLRESQRAAAGHPPSSQKPLAIILLGVAVGATLAIGVLFVMATSKSTPPKEKVAENTTSEPAMPRPQPVVTPDPAPATPQPGPTPDVQPPTPATTPVTPTPPTPEPTTPDVKTYVPSMMQPEKENIRETAAKSQLDKVKTFLAENPKEKRLVQAMLSKFLIRSNNTEAAKEGEKMLAELKQADPLPVDAKPASTDTDWNRALSLLPPIDLTKDISGGRWRWKDSTLILDRGNGKCELPYQPPEEYDYRLTFCRNGDQLLLQVLSVNKKQFAWILGGQSGCCGVSRVAGREWDENATTTYLPTPVKSGQEYVSLVEVRKTGLRVFLDNTLVCEHKTDFQDLALQNDWNLRNPAVLGIGTAGGLTVYKIEVLEVSGVGKPMRSLLPPDPNQTAAPLKPSAELIVDYENMVAEAYTQVFKSGGAASSAKIEEARKSERFSLLLPVIDLDLELLRTCDDLRKHALDGVAALKDKRPFTFHMADGSQLETGKNTERTVASVKESTIEIDHHVGGGAITVKADFDNFTLDTYYELVAIGAPKTGEGALKTALAGFIAYQKIATAPLIAKIRASLDAVKDDKLAAKVTHLKNRLAFYERDLGLELALKKLDAVIKDKKWEDARKAADAVEKDFGDTRAMARLKAQFDQRRTDIDLQLLAAAVKTNGVFAQDSSDNGLIVIEAEHFHLKVDKGEHSWVQVAPAGCSGGAAMQAQPNKGVVVESGVVAKAPRLDYRINVSKPGWFHLWVRGIGATGDDDSCHAGIDGVLVPTAADIVDFDATPTWSKTRAERRQIASFEIKTAGLHTLNIWMREDGFTFDKLIMTRNGNYTVTGEGPAETLQKR